jgi:hypothetical protein
MSHRSMEMVTSAIHGPGEGPLGTAFHEFERARKMYVTFAHHVRKIQKVGAEVNLRVSEGKANYEESLFTLRNALHRMIMAAGSIPMSAPCAAGTSTLWVLDELTQATKEVREAVDDPLFSITELIKTPTKFDAFDTRVRRLVDMEHVAERMFTNLQLILEEERDELGRLAQEIYTLSPSTDIEKITRCIHTEDRFLKRLEDIVMNRTICKDAALNYTYKDEWLKEIHSCPTHPGDRARVIKTLSARVAHILEELYPKREEV